MKNNKSIIFSSVLFLLVSFLFLAFVEKKEADLNTKNVWMIYFENSKDNSLNFEIENHANNSNFHWEILANKDSLKAGDITVAKGLTKKIPVIMEGMQNKKFTVIVTSGENKKEIYKNL
jgi:hypothetical protein